MSEREDLQEVLDKLGWKYKVPEQREGYAKVEQEPLSDEELKQIREREKFDYYICQYLFNTISRRIEKAHGIGVDDE